MERLKHHAHKTLRWSEQYFKTDMVYLAKGGFWLASLQGVASLSALLLAIAFANLVSPEVYGVYKYILSIGAIIGTLSLTGLSTAVTQSVARGFNGALQHAFWANLKWSGGVLIASLATSGYYFYQDNLTLAFAFLIIGILTPVLNSTTFFSSYLTGKKDFQTLSIYGSINSILPTAALCGALFFTDKVITLILIYFLAQAIVEFVLYKMVLKKYKPNSKEIDDAMITYGAHVSGMNMLNAVSMRLDSILLFHYLGAAQVAIYAFATAIPEQIRGLFKNIGAIAFPKWSTKTYADIKSSFWEKFWKFVLTLALIAATYAFIAPYIYEFLFPQYTESIPYSQLFALSLIAGTIIAPTMMLQAQKMTHELYQLNIASSIIQIIILLVAVPLYGIMGAILGVIISRFLSLVVSIALLR